ncbi:MAG: hypothetical protein DRP11_02695 [Candidatus Aenigmatarchaeota archaeon]|nr:MAG: hypothetical protein DRP11_02695 [Candidatus Aenigmarchaeota archaeon]
MCFHHILGLLLRKKREAPISNNFHPERYIRHLQECEKCRNMIHKHLGLFTDEEIRKIEEGFLREEMRDEKG